MTFQPRLLIRSEFNWIAFPTTHLPPSLNKHVNTWLTCMTRNAPALAYDCVCHFFIFAVSFVCRTKYDSWYRDIIMLVSFREVF